MVESPSGQLLSATEFRDRNDRQLTVKERKRAILEESRRKIAARGTEGRESGDQREGEEEERKKKRKFAVGAFLKKCGCGIGGE